MYNSSFVSTVIVSATTYLYLLVFITIYVNVFHANILNNKYVCVAKI